MKISRFTVFLCMGLFLLCGLVIAPQYAGAASFTVDFKTNTGPGVNLGHDESWAIESTGVTLDVSAWGFDGTRYQKWISHTNKNAPSGAGIGVANTSTAKTGTIDTPNVSGTRHKELFLLELSSTDLMFESITVEYIHPARTGHLELALYTPAKQQILDENEYTLIGPNKIVVATDSHPTDPAPLSQTFNLMSYDNVSNPGIWIGSWLMSSAAQNKFFYVSSITFTDGEDHPAVPEPGTMLLVGTGLIGLAGYGRRKILKKKRRRA